MKKPFLLFTIAALLPLSRLAATAQSLPVLQITNSVSGLIVSWPATNPGWTGWTNNLWGGNWPGITAILQTTTNLSANAWTDVMVPKYLVGNQVATTPLMTSGQQFFRIRPPFFLSVPIFQFAIFYNMDMEICPGSNMTVNGKTHVNGNVWADPGSGATLTFGDRMETTASNIFYTRSPNDQQASTLNPQVVYLDTNSPILNAAAATLPTGTNGTASAAFILDLPPPGIDPNSLIGQQYLYNQADIIISNSASGIISVFYQNRNNVNQLTYIPYDVTNIVAGVSTNYSYSFVTNVSFYDYRESDTANAVQFDVGKFNAWLSGNGAIYNSQNNNGSTSKGHSINSVYVYSSVSLSPTNLPAVRVVNGSVQPTQGLTIVTPFPIYVLGNYNASASDLGTTNVADTAPAALLGDAVTVLSSNWKDSYTSTTALSSRPAANTTINAATLEGMVPSVTVNGTKHFSGGVENFLRLLENWSPATVLTYNGSIVVMFNSRYATNFWQTPGNYYNVPTRFWGFDVNFKNQNKLPPLTPVVTTIR